MLFCLISGDYILRFGTAPARDFASSSEKKIRPVLGRTPIYVRFLILRLLLAHDRHYFSGIACLNAFFFIQGKLSPILHHRDFRYCTGCGACSAVFLESSPRVSRRSVIAFSRHIKPGTPDRAQNSLILRNYQDFFPITSILFLKVSSSPDQ